MNVGIVGCGRVAAQRHLPALCAIPDARVVALADVDRGRVDALASQYGVDARYGSHADLLADARVEAVAVCVPAGAHAEVAVAALEAGRNVFVEKPLALDADDAELIRSAAERTPATVMVGFNLRWHRLVRRARELLRSGAIGDLVAIRTAFTSSFDYQDEAGPWRFSRELGGGTLVEVAPHHLDLWRFLSDREAEEVVAASRSDASDDETAIVSAELGGGVLATSLFSQRTTNANVVELFGTGGRIAVDCYRYDGLEVQPRRGFSGDGRQRLRAVGRAAAGLPSLVRGRRGPYVDSYVEQWRHFLERATAGLPTECGVAEGVRNVEIVAAALRSSASGEPVRIAPRQKVRTS